MNDQLNRLVQFWRTDNIAASELAVQKDIDIFNSRHSLVLPNDLVDYFKLANGTKEDYDKNFFRFYPFRKFLSIDVDLKKWRGIPDYGNIINTLEDYRNCFVFADYSIMLFSYAIRLHPFETGTNEVYTICGDKHKIISGSFGEFIDQYLEDCSATFL
jgi:hypothetical protein